MERSTRPLTKEQVDQLRGYVGTSAVVGRAVLFLLAGAAVGWLCHLVQTLLGAGEAGPWWLVPTAAILAVLYVRSKRWTGGAELRRRVRRDIAGGEARVTRIEAVAAIEIEEQEDEGPGFIVETASGETVLFAGQYLDERRHRGFPWTGLEIIEAPHSGLFFGLEKLGQPLEIRARRKPLSLDESRALGTLDRRYVVLDEVGKALLEDAALSPGDSDPSS